MEVRPEVVLRWAGTVTVPKHPYTSLAAAEAQFQIFQPVAKDQFTLMVGQRPTVPRSTLMVGRRLMVPRSTLTAEQRVVFMAAPVGSAPLPSLSMVASPVVLPGVAIQFPMALAQLPMDPECMYLDHLATPVAQPDMLGAAIPLAPAVLRAGGAGRQAQMDPAAAATELVLREAVTVQVQVPPGAATQAALAQGVAAQEGPLQALLILLGFPTGPPVPHMGPPPPQQALTEPLPVFMAPHPLPEL